MITILEVLLKSFTIISLIQSDGYEVWYVKDFEKGPGISKWYRGYACKIVAAIRIAQLTAIGIKIPETDKISNTIQWIEFAEDVITSKTGMLYLELFECRTLRPGQYFSNFKMPDGRVPRGRPSRETIPKRSIVGGYI